MTSLALALKRTLKPVAKRVLFNAWHPGPLMRPFFAFLFQANWYCREMWEWFWRSMIATPVFLSRCKEFGTDISVDRIPYLNGNVEIHLGNRVRFSGKIDIASPNSGSPVLTIGEGVFIGHNTSFDVAQRVEIGDFTSIGSGCQISDTEGHSHYNPQRPIWEVPASAEDIAPVIIEDNVQIGRNVTILKGVTIGARSVIGAESVVRKNIPADSIVMGNPGRVVTRIQTEDKQEEK